MAERFPPRNGKEEKSRQERKEEVPKGHLMTRRTALRFLLGLGVTAFVVDGQLQRMHRAGDTVEDDVPGIPEITHIKFEQDTQWVNPLEAVPNNPRLYPTGSIAGHKTGVLLSKYFGLENGQQIPEALSADFRRILADMWTEKYLKTRKISEHESGSVKVGSDQSSNALHEEVTDAGKEMAHFGSTLVNEYDVDTSEKMSIDGFLSSVQKSIDGLPLENLLRDLCKGMPSSCSSLMTKMAKLLSAREMTAFLLTEIMPTSDGKRNLEYLSFLLEHAGKDFVERIPALGDTLVSFGPFQMTHFPIGEIQRLRVGGSVVPKSIEDLRGDAHTQSAYIFALINISKAVRGIHHPEIFEQHLDELTESITSFIATAHHQPASATSMFQLFANDFVRHVQKQEQQKKEKATKPGVQATISSPVPTYHRTLVIRKKSALVTYSRKTMGNYRHTRVL